MISDAEYELFKAGYLAKLAGHDIPRDAHLDFRRGWNSAAEQLGDRKLQGRPAGFTRTPRGQRVEKIELIPGKLR